MDMGLGWCGDAGGPTVCTCFDSSTVRAMERRAYPDIRRYVMVRGLAIADRARDVLTIFEGETHMAISSDDLFMLADEYSDQGNHSVAFALFLRGAENGDRHAMSRVAVMLGCGEGCAINVDQSIAWDLKAIELGSSLSVLNLGITYRQRGDLLEACRYFELALSLGETEAALELARLYSVSKQESSRVWAYLNQVITSHTVSEDSIEEAQALLRSLGLE